MNHFRSASLVGIVVLCGSAICLLLLSGHIGGARAQTTPQGTWTVRAPLPLLRSQIGAAAYGGRIYVIGGSTKEIVDGTPVDRPALDTNYAYDPAADMWIRRAPMPQGANRIGTTVWDGKIYVAGGVRGPRITQETDAFYAYDPERDQWEVLRPLPRPRGALALAAVNGKIHAIAGRRLGGQTGEVLADHDVYDVDTGSWSLAAPLPSARDHVGIGVIDGMIHIFGGRAARRGMLLSFHDVYDPQTDRWTAAAPLPTPRSDGAYAEYRGMLLYIGGECTPDRMNFIENEAYNPRTDTWLTLTPLPGARHGLAAAAVGNSLYVVGGSNPCGGDAVLLEDNNLVFTLP